MARPTKIEEIDNEIRKKLIYQLYNEGINVARISRIFKMHLQNVWTIINK